MNPSTQIPTQGRIVLVKYLNTAGIPASLDTIPGIVVRVKEPTDPGKPHRLTVTVFGDGQPFAPTAGAYTLPQSVPLYDPTNPESAAQGADKVTVPDDAAIMRGGPFDGKPVWAEWMPYQKTKAAAEKAAGGSDAPPR